MPAEFIIPKCKIQSNFTFTMASSGDPSTFTFTIDAFPDYTRFEKTEKVLASIQVINEGSNENVLTRESTAASMTHGVNANGNIYDLTPNADAGLTAGKEVTIGDKVYILTEKTEPTALNGDGE
jgi:hypothetical protein